ncbi:MAG: hypothetical protein HYY13_03660 [Nitrospirae bacterium]|nr:hypothetical protein [Nitrospirota bacterium]
MSKYLLQAEKFHKKALAEFLKAKRNGLEETDIIQAAEKGWLAAHRATNALLERHGKKITAGTQRKQQDLIDLERVFPEIKRSAITDKFNSFHSNLHVAAGCMDFVSAKLIERHIRAVGEYIQTIRRLTARGG